MPHLKPKDIVALSVISVLFVFKMTGHNGSLDVPLGIIIGYYFGHRGKIVDKGV